MNFLKNGVIRTLSPNFVCPECGHEWNLELENENYDDQKVIKDANGNVLNDGDSVTVIKDLKVKGSSSVLKVGTKVKNIGLVDGDHKLIAKLMVLEL